MKKKIHAFLNHYMSHFSKDTLYNYKLNLLKLAKFLNFRNDFSDHDIIDYFNSPSFQKLKISTQNLYKLRIKKFLTYLGKNTDFIQKRREIKKELNKEQLLTAEDITAVLDTMQRPLDRCLFIMLLESKMRITEATNLKLEHVVDKGSYFTVYIEESKSAQRTIPLVLSAPYIVNYLNSRPKGGKYFFVCQYRGKTKQYSRNGLRDIIYRNSKHIPKHVYPHLLRHTGLTDAAKHLSDSQLMQIAGWKTRTMIDKYVHLASDDLENAILELHGLEVPKKDKGMKMVKNKVCAMCKTTNPATATFCSHCGRYLDSYKALTLEKDAQTLRDTFDLGAISEAIVRILREHPELVRKKKD